MALVHKRRLYCNTLRFLLSILPFPEFVGGPGKVHLFPQTFGIDLF